MKVMIFGATGMVGQSVLRECLLDVQIKEVLTVGRRKAGVTHPKVKELEASDLFDLSEIEHELKSYDVCFYCLGVSAFRMTEADYTKITYDMTLSIAQTLLRSSPNLTFIYVSGMGTDSSEHGRQMWARVKGKTENALLKLPFQSAYMFRPGGIIPMYGVKSKTRWYQLVYKILKPFYPLLLKSKTMISSEQFGKAMIRVARDGYKSPVIESVSIKELAN